MNNEKRAATTFHMLYAVEHRLLPHMIYKHPYNIGLLLKGKGLFIKEYYRIVAEDYIAPVFPYTPNDIKVDGFRFTYEGTEIFVVLVNMPDPKDALLCKRIYIVHDRFCSQIGYYTIELNQQGGYFICSWDAKGKHNNYGDCNDIDTELGTIVYLYTRVPGKLRDIVG